MLIKTKHFGAIDIDDDKIVTFENGIMGFEDCKKFTLLYDNEKEERSPISWFQCVDKEDLALPVINPLIIKEDYRPEVEDELLIPLGELNDENLVILTTLTVPTDITRMSVNLKAPIVINADTKKGCQMIAENADYEIKYYIYDLVKARKEKGDA